MRPSVWIPAVVVLAAVVGLWWWTSQRSRPEPPVAAAPAPIGTVEGVDALSPPEPGGPSPAQGGASPEGVDALAEAWASVDMDEVRRALPDNLYWEMAVPTQDLREIDRRAEERARWNEEYGRILAGDANEEEIQAYYDHRTRLSSDYVEFVDYLLANYGDRIPERDVGLLKLASRLHLARLEEIPRKRQQAIDRMQEMEDARRRWGEEQQDWQDPEEPRAGAAAPR